MVRGTFPVTHNGEEIGRYSVEVEFPADYPDDLPIVREVAGRIPWTAEFHVFVSGVACVLLPEQRWWSFPPGSRFLEYLKGPLHNYFLGQVVVAAGGKWPFGEHRHGLDGVIDFYAEQFGTQDVKLIIPMLEMVGKGKARGHLPCPCGTGRKLRNCHPGILTVAHKMPAWAARESLERISDTARKISEAREKE